MLAFSDYLLLLYGSSGEGAYVLCRASMEGPVWCLVLQQFMSALENSVDEDERLTVVPDFVRLVSLPPSVLLMSVHLLTQYGTA